MMFFGIKANKFMWAGIAYISIGCIIVYVIAFAVGLGQRLSVFFVFFLIFQLHCEMLIIIILCFNSFYYFVSFF